MQNHHSKPEDLMLQNAKSLRKSAPRLPNISHEHVSCTALPRNMYLCRSSSNVPCLPWFFDMLPQPSRFAQCSLLTRCTIPCACHAKRACGVFNILTWKRASRHNSVHFSDISTSESGPELVCFVHFDLEMCFALQRRALFQHLNFQKWSDPVSFSHVWLRSVLFAPNASVFNIFDFHMCLAHLRATTACTFSTSQLPKMLRTCQFLTLLTSHLPL